MARQQETAVEETTSASTVTTETASTEAPATEKASRPKVVLKLDEEAAKDFGGVVGQEVARKDYILKRFSVDGVDRGPIAKELTRLESRNVPYQIVFQATKGISKGKPAVAPAETEASAAAK